MQTIFLFVFPFINAILNRWPRGTYSWGPWVAAAVMAVLIFLITTNIFAAGAFFALYVAGESFGWGKFLAVIPHSYNKDYTQEMYLASKYYARDDGKNNGIHLLANLLCKEEKDFRGYAWWALVFRGLLWYAPILAALAGLGVVNIFVAPIAAIVIAFMFPICYNLTYKLFNDSYWTMGELLYGLVQGIVMAIALASGIYL